MRQAGATARRASSRRQALLTGAAGDVLLYAASAVLAGCLAVVTVYHGHRVWGVISAVGFAAGAMVTAAIRHRAGHVGHRQRLVVAAAVFAACGLVPLVVLVAQRGHSVAWSAQPEVEVVERMAALLLDTGTPYADPDELGRAPQFRDYTPYLPAMAIFGLPRALAGDTGIAGMLTDARLVFAVAAAGLLVVAVRMLRPERLPVRAVQLVAVLPATTLTFATGGDDLPVLGLLVLAMAGCWLGRSGVAGLAGGLALAMKLTAAPVLLVLTVATAAAGAAPAATAAAGRSGRPGLRGAVVFAGTALVTAAVLVLPSALVAPGELVEHVIRFPAGLTGVDSPAASPLPGYLLAQSGTAGRAAALAALAVAAASILIWVLFWPPLDAARAAERAAISLVIAMLLMPATRFGYLIYPLVLLGTALALRSCSIRSEVSSTPALDPRAHSPVTE